MDGYLGRGKGQSVDFFCLSATGTRNRDRVLSSPGTGTSPSSTATERVATTSRRAIKSTFGRRRRRAAVKDHIIFRPRRAENIHFLMSMETLQRVGTSTRKMSWYCTTSLAAKVVGLPAGRPPVPDCGRRTGATYEENS